MSSTEMLEQYKRLMEDKEIVERIHKYKINKNGNTIIREFDCPVCSKHFCISTIEMWTYKRSVFLKGHSKGILLCSYGCMRRFDSVMGDNAKGYKRHYDEKRGSWR